MQLTRLELRQLVNLVSCHGLTSDGEPTKYYELMRKLIETENNMPESSVGIELRPRY